ncbi:leucyl aminopeptidase family protein [Actinoplanes ianthinogenes]|uniref:leucyl aminopeptidase family protein n=1 Tax=Actinoplanes ianthinogenes TaxID=122358 RepID=UPI003CC811A3
MGLTEELDEQLTWVVPAGHVLAGEVGAELSALPAPGVAGEVTVLPRPLRRPARVLLAGIGDGDEAGWRAAGAGIVRALADDDHAQVVLPPGLAEAAVRGLAEGLWLGGYRYREAATSPRSADVELVADDMSRYAGFLDLARATARATWLARDLTNTPASTKNPEWFADQVVELAAGRSGLTATVLAGADLERFGGLVAVGGGSVSPPRFVELSWTPAESQRHVALVGKGITFDTGGISIKPREAMRLMKKDMGGAAAVLGATLAAAELNLPVRVTALLPLAENAIGAAAFRPGDVIRHYDGTTTETTNSDAEGRLVLADALGYATERVAPDTIVVLATLTGANAVALGKRTAALYSEDDALAGALEAAGAAAGERMWRLPLPGDYVEYMRSDIADRHSSPTQVHSLVAALYLREFMGGVKSWAHLDMSAPSWAEDHDLELTKGATGWGARTLIRYLLSA